MQLHHRGWMFLRPSCTGASLGSLSQGSILWPQPLVRVTLKSRSVLAIVGKCVIALLANLGEMEDSKAFSECIKKRSTYAGTTKPLSVPVSVRYPFLVFLEGLLNQRVVRSLTHRLHTCGIPGNMNPFGSELRNDILIVLTRIFNAWIVFPHISFYDQCPPRLPLERLIATLQSINRKTTTRLSQRQEYLSSISGVHTTLIQHINMLLLAAAKLECSWNCFSIQRKNILDGKPSRFVAESASFVQLAQFSRIANIIRKYYTSALVLTPPPFLSVSEDSPLRQQINTSIPITSFTTERLLSSGPIVDLIPLRGNTGVDSSLFPSLTYCPWRRRPNGLISCSAEKYTTLYSSVGIRKGAKVYFEVRLPYSTGTSIAVGCVTEAYIGNTLMTASKSTIPDAYNFPLGQCNQSWAFDGSRLCRWHNGLKQDTINRVTKWKPRDVIGIRIDFCGGGEVMRLGYSQLESCTSTVAPMMSGGVMQCFHNGKLMSQFDNLEIRTPDVSTSDINVIASASRDDCSHVLYPAITFGTSGCEVNFGSAPFAYDLPPDCAPLDPHHYFMASSLQHQAGTLQTMLSQYVRQNRKEKLDFSSNKIDTETVESTPDKVALSALMTDILQRLSNLEAHIPSNYSTVSSKSVSYLRSGPPVVRLYQPDQYLRCDSCSGTEVFPYSTSMVLRGNACVYSGKWYYEVVVEGEGLFSVGWCTKHYNFSDISATGRGPTKLTLGDDSNSWALDGVRMVLKHNKVHRSLGRHQWKEGDVVGCLLDGEKGTIGFTINGQPLKDVHDTTGEDTLLTNVKISDGMFPAITLEDGNSVCVGFSPKQVYGLKLLSDDLYKKNSDSSGASTLPLSHRRKVGAATLK